MKDIWNKIEFNVYPSILLSDSVISKCVLCEGELSLIFEDGFVKKYKDNKYYYTDIAKYSVFFDEISNFNIYVRSTPSEKITLYELSIYELIEKINNKQWKCEIVEEFYSCNSMILKVFYKGKIERGWIYFSSPFNRIGYFWNNVDFLKPF